MKFTVTMKDPDTLGDAIRRAVKADVEKLGLPDDEADALEETRCSKVSDVCGTWFKWGEYLTVEVDTDAKTATVVNAR